MPKCITCNGAGVVDYLFEGKALSWKCPACEGTGNAQDVTVPRGCPCCDPTSVGEEPVFVRLERENACLRGLLREVHNSKMTIGVSCLWVGVTMDLRLRIGAALEGKT